VNPKNVFSAAKTKRMKNAESPVAEEAKRLLELYSKETEKRWDRARPKEFPAGKAILDGDPALQIEAVLQISESRNQRYSWRLDALYSAIMQRNLPFTAADLERILKTVSSQSYPHRWSSIIRQVRRFVDSGSEMTPGIREHLVKMRRSNEYNDAETRKAHVALDELLGNQRKGARPDAGETWSDLARADLDAMAPALQVAWECLFHLLQTAEGSKPTRQFEASVKPLVQVIGDSFVPHVVKWFQAVSTPPLKTHRQTYGARTIEYVTPTFSDRNVSFLKGLAWSCAGRPETEVARALARLVEGCLKKIPGTGPWAVRAASAAVWALGETASTESVAALSRLNLKVSHRGTVAQIEKAIESAAQKQGIPRDELEDLAVPTFGLYEQGVRHEQFGEAGSAELRLDSAGAITLSWFGPGAKPLKSPPAAVKQQHGDELKALKADSDNLQKTLTAQSQRIEAFLLTNRTWTLEAWRERYLNHPVLGNIARRLIWRFGDGDSAGIWSAADSAFVDQDGSRIEIPESASVRLWHPIHASVENIERWRGLLETPGIRQPFKQAYREVYLITDAEMSTRVYSNRYAGHILKQHQMNQLAAQRGWKNKLRLLVDDEYPPAHLEIPQHNMRAEFWIEGAGDDYGTDTNDTGTFLYLVTDQVRFYPMGTPVNTAHASGGGYGTYIPEQAPEPIQLDRIPPLVFSEVMRDVDLFVGVCSVGNDPTWADGGPEGRHRDYWQQYAFGELSATAKTRAEVLARLLPRLKIAPRCELDGRFLRVKGDIRTYKIHLGSANILMEPNDQYLCIVPGRSAAVSGTSNLFLPFEGDGRMALVLSKAFLLAEDTKINDPTITSQLRRR
jgi:hypothetical protein